MPCLKNVIIFMSNFNINWKNKTCRRKLRDHRLFQIIQGPTRGTQSSQTQIDLVFTNRPDRIIKSSNLLTGMYDHNVTLVVRKITKKRFKNHINVQQYNKKIQKSKQSNYDAAISQIDWSDLLSNEDPESGYRTFDSY